MKISEQFAIDEWLTDYPSNMEYDEIMAVLNNAANEWCIDDIVVWELVEHHTMDQVAEFIDMTRKHFERSLAEYLKTLEGQP